MKNENVKMSPAEMLARDVAKVEWKRFTENDWMGFAGCERFADGSEPFLAEIKVDGFDGLAIFDANGVVVLYASDADSENEDGVEHEFYTTSAAAVLLFATTSRAVLKAMGFRQGHDVMTPGGA